MADWPASGAGRALPGSATEAAFLLGGIGTGNVSLGARGELRDWEIFNRPGKGNSLPFTFFAIWAQAEGAAPVTRVLEARRHPPYRGSHGYYPGAVAGLPRLTGSVMRGEYPFVWIEFEDSDLPVTVTLEAFTPFIPLDAADSGLPSAILRYRVRNTGPRPASVTIVGSLYNAAGLDGYELFFFPRLVGTPRQGYRDEGALRGLWLSVDDLPAEDPRYGSLALVTRDSTVEVTVKERWLEGLWWDGVQDFWDDLCQDGRLDFHSALHPLAGGARAPVGSLGLYRDLAPGSMHDFEFCLAWHFPNRGPGWGGHIFPAPAPNAPRLQNYYATRFDDAWQVAGYLCAHLPRLEQRTRDFHHALFGSTLPPEVLDAVSANLAVLRSTTCWRLADGTLLGWEGGFDQQGSCEGTCTHVWNYAQAAAFLFPELERSMRRVEFLLETDESGRLAVRTNQVVGGPRWDVSPASDGQLGAIVRLCREWQLSGDDDFLRALWPKAGLALDYAIEHWDADGDAVLDQPQPNTYDVEFHGVTSLSNSLFYAALAAGARMATHLGEAERASRYQALLERGSRLMDERLWNGEYYEQDYPAAERQRYQYGRGCLSDQVFGQLLAHITGLGYVLPQAHVRQALRAVRRHNFRQDLYHHHHVQRAFALHDEAGLLLCTWPRGGRPHLPFPYCDEVWTGVEYQVAAHLIYEGDWSEGLELVRAVRARYDGVRRNPWSEIECGNHYARSLASWALLLALSGVHCDLSNGTLSFVPRMEASTDPDRFACLWSCGRGWGLYQQVRDQATGVWQPSLQVLGGDMSGVLVTACGQKWTM